jgi:sulfide dehydrogenase cytochrome subunit
MRDPICAFALCFLAFAGVPPAGAQAPTVIERCTGCHDRTGRTDDPDIPTLAGIGRFYLENQFAVFAAEARPCVIDALDGDVDKCAIIGSLTEAQRRELAAHFAQQDYRPFEQRFDDALAERGEALHAARCERCHTDAGWEPLDDAGLLAGQPIPYLVRQLEFFASGARWQPEFMASETDGLNDEQIRALAHFYARAGMRGRDGGPTGR